MTWPTCLAILFLLVIADTHGKHVRDVDSSIIDEIQQNPSNAYLIKFHAPWFVLSHLAQPFSLMFIFRCGHCRKFESTYEEIAQEVHDLSETVDEFRNLHLVRLDATVYGDVANHYDIRGYPTLKFVRGSQILTFENERTKPAVLNFLKRANGPALRWISSVEKFDQLRREHDVFFLFVTSEQPTDPLKGDYENLVLQYLSQAYFYATNDSLLRQTYLSEYPASNTSQVFVVKTEGIYLYEPNQFHPTLEEFIVRENVPGFPQVATGNIRDLIMTKKILIIYAFEDQRQSEDEKRRRSVESLGKGEEHE